MEAFFKDLKHSLRMFAQSPAFTLAAVAALTLGIGANTAVMNYTGGQFPEQLKSARVSADFLKLVGAPFRLGRNFSADEDKPQGPKVAVISRSLWETRLNGDPAI